MVHVIVERSLSEPVTEQDVRAQMSQTDPCAKAHRVRHLRTSLSLDGLRMICEYEAPDAESVRRANQLANKRYDRVWTATVMLPERSRSEPR